LTEKSVKKLFFQFIVVAADVAAADVVVVADVKTTAKERKKERSTNLYRLYQRF